jgi:argininosuccinate lyase
VGSLVGQAENAGKQLNQLSLADFKAAHAAFEEDVLKVFDTAKTMNRRRIPGSPGTIQVKKQIVRWKKALQ